MQLYHTPAEWAKVKPETVVEGSKAQVRNVLEMALSDIASLAQEIANESEGRIKLERALRDKDAAMSVLFKRYY